MAGVSEVLVGNEMKTKLKWRYTMEAIPNQDGKYLCVVRDSIQFKYDLLAFDVASRQWMHASIPFNTDYVIAWARLPLPEDIVEDDNNADKQ